MSKSDESKRKSGDYVNVGDEIGLESQYLGDENSTYLADGKVIAAIPGIIAIDEKKRTIKVDAKNEENRIFPEPGDFVTGRIYSIRKNSIGVKILTVNKKLVVSMGFIGNIHISKVASRYVEKITNIVSKNDFIKAVVVQKNHAEYQLRTDEPSLGVIKTYCKYCGKKMDQKGKDQVICPFCNHYERKLLAQDYNNLEIVLDL